MTMTDTPIWQLLLLGVGLVLLLMWWGPGIKAALKNPNKGTAADWKGLLLPIGAVIVFVVLLVLLARS